MSRRSLRVRLSERSAILHAFVPLSDPAAIVTLTAEAPGDATRATMSATVL
jgi:hypothetical protein